jgi:regulator of sigma E protease
MNVLLFLAVLFLLVLVHELGHFIVAKKTGMRVDEFGIGFPPRLFGIRRGETLYSLNAIPLGGFVKIYGEDADATEGGPGSERAFSKRSLTSQALVLIAGVACNVLFAWLLFSLAFVIGTKSTVDEATASDRAELTVLSVLPGSPAEEAGIRPGEHIVFVANENGHPVDALTPTSVSSFIQEYGTVTLRVERDENVESIILTAKSGLTETDKERKVVGVSMGLVETERLSLFPAIGAGFMQTLTGISAVTVGIWTLLSQAVLLSADLSQVAGPVGMAGLVGDAASFGLTSLIMFTAFISLNLAVINVLPFPALDGGRLLFVAIEAIKGSPLPTRVSYITNAVGFFLLMALMVAVTYQDIVRIIR